MLVRPDGNNLMMQRKVTKGRDALCGKLADIKKGRVVVVFDGKPVLTQRYEIVADALSESLSAHHQHQHQRHKGKHAKKNSSKHDEAAAEGAAAAAHAANEEHEPHWLASQCAKVSLNNRKVAA